MVIQLTDQVKDIQDKEQKKNRIYKISVLDKFPVRGERTESWQRRGHPHSPDWRCRLATPGQIWNHEFLVMVDSYPFYLKMKFL